MGVATGRVSGGMAGRDAERRGCNRWTGAVAMAIVAASAPVGCGGGNLASALARAPANPNHESMCGTTKIQARPLIVEWPSSDRAALEARIKQGVVPVRFVGCDMEVVTTCRLPAAYVYTGITPKNDKVVIHDTDELYASIPVHAASFESKLATAGSLDVAMTIIGRYESNQVSVHADQLQGECGAATHVITALTVGSFTFSAGAEAEVGAALDIQGAGAGGKSTAKKETLNTDGDPRQCEKATSDDKAPPFGCGALLRVELLPLGEARGDVVLASYAPDGPAPSTAPAGAQAVASVQAAATVSPGAGPAGSSRPAAPSAASTPDDYQKACDGGDSTACVTLGEMFYNARGVGKDGKRAFALFKKACDAREPTGCVDLGWAYVSGTGIEKNAALAADSFGRACDGSTVVGCIGLGQLYRDGNGVPRDGQKASRLFKQACDGGNDFGCKLAKAGK